MVYIVDGMAYCDACGMDMALDDDASAVEGESDSPNHCANESACKDVICLHDYGLAKDAPLYGAESCCIGALLPETLTSDGIHYVREMVSAPNPTPYQQALHRLWLETWPEAAPQQPQDKGER